MARIISVCNFKGGAGKSTVSVNLACGLAVEAGARCILVDADRQGTSAAWAAQGRLPVPVAHRVLHEAHPDDRFPGSLWVTQLRQLAETVDHVVIDLPPSLQYALPAVAIVSDVVIVPVSASGAEIHSTRLFIELLRTSRRIRGGKPGCLILPNRLDGRTAAGRSLARYEAFGEPVVGPLHLRQPFARGFDEGRWVGDLAAGSPAHKEVKRLVGQVLDWFPPETKAEASGPVRSPLEATYPHLGALRELSGG